MDFNNSVIIQWGKSSVALDNYTYRCTLPIANNVYCCVITPQGASAQHDNNDSIVAKTSTIIDYRHNFTQCTAVYFITCGF